MRKNKGYRIGTQSKIYEIIRFSSSFFGGDGDIIKSKILGKEEREQKSMKRAERDSGGYNLLFERHYFCKQKQDLAE